MYSQNQSSNMSSGDHSMYSDNAGDNAKFDLLVETLNSDVSLCSANWTMDSGIQDSSITGWVSHGMEVEETQSVPLTTNNLQHLTKLVKPHVSAYNLRDLMATGGHNLSTIPEMHLTQSSRTFDTDNLEEEAFSGQPALGPKRGSMLMSVRIFLIPYLILLC